MHAGMLGGWKPRYFELSEDELAFYAEKRSADAAPLGVLPLNCLHQVRLAGPDWLALIGWP